MLSTARAVFTVGAVQRAQINLVRRMLHVPQATAANHRGFVTSSIALSLRPTLPPSVIPPPLPQDAPKPFLYALERAVVEDRPLNEFGRAFMTALYFAGLLTGSLYAYYWQTWGDGATPRTLRELSTKYAHRVPSDLPELRDFDLKAIFDSELDVNKLAGMIVPTWWIRSESMLSAQLDSYIGYTSQFLHANVWHLLRDIFLTLDVWVLYRNLRTPWLPAYMSLLVAVQCGADAPSYNAPPFLHVHAELEELADRIIEHRDIDWVRLYDAVHETSIADAMEAFAAFGEQAPPLPVLMEAEYSAHNYNEWTAETERGPLSSWLHWLACDVSSELTSNSSAQAFWLLTFLTEPLSDEDIALLCRPITGMMPLLAGLYTMAWMEAGLVARKPTAPYLLRVVAIGLIVAAGFVAPQVGASATEQALELAPVPDSARQQLRRNVTMQVYTDDALRTAAGIFTGALTWVFALGPGRAVLYLYLRRRAAARMAGAFIR